MYEVLTSLKTLVEQGGSDLHIKVGAPPLYRIKGELVPVGEEAPVSEADSEAALKSVLPDESKLNEFEDENEADFSFEIADVSRFRVNAYRQRGLISLAFRAIPNAIRSIEELQLPDVVRELAEEERGIVLLTGTTGSGKSTTLAAMINHINSTMAKHIVTIEDPIEYVHNDKSSAINQREVGMDTASFGRAMRRVLRQDPDVILIGEMRDEETVRAALSAAETGHLVMSTVHTLDASESINRILDFFPPHQHNQARSMIAGTLRGVISQRLVRSIDGGRVAVCEVLRMTGRVHDMIKDPEQMGKLGDVIFSGGYYGMQTFDQALFKHVKAKRVLFEDAVKVATSPHDFKLLVEADGRRGTTMEDVAHANAQANGSGAAAQSPAATATPAAPKAATAAVAPGIGAPSAPVAPPAQPPVGAPSAQAGNGNGAAGGPPPSPSSTGLSSGVTPAGNGNGSGLSSGVTPAGNGNGNGLSGGVASGLSSPGQTSQSSALAAAPNPSPASTSAPAPTPPAPAVPAGSAVPATPPAPLAASAPMPVPVAPTTSSSAAPAPPAVSAVPPPAGPSVFSVPSAPTASALAASPSNGTSSAVASPQTSPPASPPAGTAVASTDTADAERPSAVAGNVTSPPPPPPATPSPLSPASVLTAPAAPAPTMPAPLSPGAGVPVVPAANGSGLSAGAAPSPVSMPVSTNPAATAPSPVPAPAAGVPAISPGVAPPPSPLANGLTPGVSPPVPGTSD